ncbi:TetR/AcrR family transcriptional regulator [Arthrobacter sp. NPDC056493]|uniref:TetR/AcrR family transcriptional regulator n=1 Tax=Arthrobacter sp. NPDC056493 TaxID=3345839 RepID=UPI00366EE922
MTIATPVADDRRKPGEPGEPGAVRSRDAGNTRQQLLQAARRRFAFDGYSATTVRDIATDVGVNVALINRYFTSKEGLFEACLASAGEHLSAPEATEVTVDEILKNMISHVAGSPTRDDPLQLQLLLMLRSSGDERADSIRRNLIRSFAERMAAAAGWQPADADGERFVLRAQIALATAVGIVLLRSSTGVEPLTSASEEELSGPVGEVLGLLLSPSGDSRR